MSTDALRHVFTVDEYDEMIETGVFGPDQRMELLDGVIYDMTPIGPRHAGKVDRLNQVLMRGLGDEWIVRVQGPVELSKLSEPQPDLTVLRRTADYYEGGHPGPDDVFLMIEVSDSSALRDRTVKRALYARAGIGEVWIVDLNAGVIEVGTDPGPDGYRAIRVVRAGEELAPTGFPSLRVPTADLLS